VEEETTTTTVLRPFFQDHPGEPVSEESFFWTYGARKDNKRQTHNPGGRHSIQTNQQSTSINPPTFMPDALPAATLPIYPGLEQAQEYAGLHTPVAWFSGGGKRRGNRLTHIDVEMVVKTLVE